MKVSKVPADNSSVRLRRMVAIAVFVALSYICCVLFHFKVSFLSFELKDAVMTVAAMLFGPVAGAITVLTVCLIEFITISGTGFYGLVMNILSSVTFVCVGSLLYTRNRRISGAIFGMICATIAMVIVMLAANLLITPYYMISLGNNMSVGDIAAMIPTLLLPFNLTKAVFNSAIVFLLYKPISNALKSSGFLRNTTAAPEEATSETGSKTPNLLVLIVASVLCAACLMYFFLGLGGTFSLS